jgi:hypothetical protein
MGTFTLWALKLKMCQSSSSSSSSNINVWDYFAQFYSCQFLFPIFWTPIQQNLSSRGSTPFSPLAGFHLHFTPSNHNRHRPIICWDTCVPLVIIMTSKIQKWGDGKITEIKKSRLDKRHQTATTKARSHIISAIKYSIATATMSFDQSIPARSYSNMLKNIGLLSVMWGFGLGAAFVQIPSASLLLIQNGYNSISTVPLGLIMFLSSPCAVVIPRLISR